MRAFRIWQLAVMAMYGVANMAKADRTEEVTLLPGLTVTEHVLRQNEPVGPYNQPKWTSGGQIGAESVYVLPAWNVELSQRWFPEIPRRGESDNAFQNEIEVGLPYRFQADFNEDWGVDSDGHVQQRGIELEGRWAFADWDVIPLNPTLYFEWEFNNGDSENGSADAYELKLLLAEQFYERWHWAFNFINEQQVGGGRTTEFKATQTLTYTLIDDKLTAGVEMKFEDTTEDGSRSDPEIEFLLGPSLTWRPTQHTHLDVVPLFGLTGDAPTMEAIVVFGIEFGAESTDHGAAAPASMRGR